MWSTTLCRIGSIHLPCTANHIEIVMELTQVFPYGSHGDSVVLLVNYRNSNQPYDTQENKENKTITKLTANNLWHFKLLFYHLHASIWSTCREVYIFLWDDGRNWVAKLNLNPWEECRLECWWDEQLMPVPVRSFGPTQEGGLKMVEEGRGNRDGKGRAGNSNANRLTIVWVYLFECKTTNLNMKYKHLMF